MKKNIYYYTLEDMEGHIKIATATRRLAVALVTKDIYNLVGNEGICYKRKVGDAKYKKFAFIW